MREIRYDRQVFVDMVMVGNSFRGGLKGFLVIIAIAVTSCVGNESPRRPTPVDITREIGHLDLALHLAWSRRFQSAQMNATVGLACTDGYGAAILENLEPMDDQWQGLIVFDAEGQVVWNHENEWLPGAVATDMKRLYLLVPPNFRAYALETGELLWSTEEGLRYRIGPPYLYLTGNDLVELQSLGQLNVYKRSDGALVSAQKFPYRDFAQHHDGLDIHIHSRREEALLYATPASDSNQLLWSKDTPAASGLVIYQDSAVGEFLTPGGGQQLCRLRVTDGEMLWCNGNDLHLISNIAVRGELGYAVDQNTDLFAFQFSDGVAVGEIDFEPEIATNRRYQLAACGEHLLAYLSNPDELYWFDFIDKE